MSTPSVIPEHQREFFFLLRDSLAIYAHSWMGIEEDIYARPNVQTFGSMDLYHEDVFKDALHAAWNNPQIINDFIVDNSDTFPPEILQIAKTWREPLSTLFTVFVQDGRALFLCDDHLFEVTGLSEPVVNILSGWTFPAVVYATLLPYEGMVVYDGLLMPFPAEMGPGMRKLFEEEIAQALDANDRVATAERLMEVAPQIREAHIQRQAQSMLDDLEREQQLRQSSTGCHRGALAGLAEEEREAAIDREFRALTPRSKKGWAASVLKEETTKGAVTRSLAELIATEKKVYLHRWARFCGLDMKSNATKKELVAALTPALPEAKALPDATLHTALSPRQLAAYRNLYEAGGMLEVAEEGLETLAGLPPSMRLLCYLFYTKGDAKGTGTFTFVIPEEMMRTLDAIDWDDVAHYVDMQTAAADIADAITYLRGLVPFEDAYAEFERFHPGELDEIEFFDIVSFAIEDDIIGCCLLEDEEDGRRSYLLAYELAYVWSRESGQLLDADEYDKYDEYDEYDEYDKYDEPFEPFLVGSIEPVEFVFDLQRGKDPRPLEEGMLSTDELYDWKASLPAVRALRDFLDANVPDDANDYFFADKVIEDLIDIMSSGLVVGSSAFSTYLEIVENNGFVGDEAHMHRLVDLLMNMVNSIPNWANNGWSPHEVMERSTGRKQFYNPDGSVMKVGRNDPCPCGSGKKYKHCCGRNAHS